MDSSPRSNNKASGVIRTERRNKPRIRGPYPAIISTVDAGGTAFKQSGAIDNVSATGLYMQLRRRVNPGARFFAVFFLSTALSLEHDGPSVAVRGRVVRCETGTGDSYGVAVEFSRTRLL